MSLSESRDAGRVAADTLPKVSKPAGLSRRDFLLRAVATAALAQLGTLAPREASAAQSPPEKSKKQEHAEKVAHEPGSLVLLDSIGAASFVDAIVSLAREDDSVVQKLMDFLHIPTSNKKFHNEHDHHSSKFPLENLGLALLLNVMRATAFGEHERHETLHEMETTVKGVGLLMGLTSLAKGIVSGEVEANRLAKASPEDIAERPERVIEDSIFQLSYLAAATQLPLTAFGNASIGNGEFTEIKLSFKSIYDNLPDSRLELEALLKDKKITNKQIAKRVKAVLKDGALADGEKMRNALRQQAREHANDVVSLLMATSCDDAQAAAGDAGPLIGLVQSFGPQEAAKAIPAILPYTVLIAIERSKWAAKRAGISGNILTRERLKYGADFVATTWVNLIMYIVTVAPNIIAKFADKDTLTKRVGAGMEFSLIGQLATDVHRISSAIFSTMMGSFDGDHLDQEKLQVALSELGRAESEVSRRIGEEIRCGKGAVNVSGVRIAEIHDEVVGPKADDPALMDLQERVEQLAWGKVEEEDEVHDEEPSKPLSVEEGVNELAETLQQLKKDILPELQHAIHDYEEQHGEKPSVMAIAAILRKNPKILDLVNFNYWHDRIGPELTDTMFVIFLQGFHLVFLINSVSRGLYSQDAFKKLPLPAQEWISMGLNEFISMFADNWADCIAHSKWLTPMYFSELDKNYTDALREKYPDIVKLMGDDYFTDDATRVIPDRFKNRQEQFAVLITYLKRKDELNRDKQYLDDLMARYSADMEKYYWRTLIMAMLAAVTGGGKSKLGNAPHFTFAAGHEDFTLMETLRDFKNHPVYHLWEFIFGAAYATIAGPIFAQEMFGGDFMERSQQFFQERFRNQFPGFEEKLKELEAKEGWGK